VKIEYTGGNLAVMSKRNIGTINIDVLDISTSDHCCDLWYRSINCHGGAIDEDVVNETKHDGWNGKVLLPTLEDNCRSCNVV